MFRPANTSEVLLETNIFSEDFQLTYFPWKIIIHGNGNVANITFFDQEQHHWQATLTVYPLSLLKSNILYQQTSLVTEPETLINTWFTKYSHHCIIKYADDTQSAFVFLSEGNAFEDLEKLSELYQVIYFRERAFSIFLYDNLELTLPALHGTPGMDKNRMQLFFNHTEALYCLIQCGTTKEQLINVDVEILKKCFDAEKKNLQEILKHFTLFELFNLEVTHLTSIINHIDNFLILVKHGLTNHHLAMCDSAVLEKCLQVRHLEDILQFVSLSQVLKLDATPIPLDIIQEKNNRIQLLTSINHFGSGTVGQFSFEYNENSINVTQRDDNSGYFYLKLMKPNEAILLEISQKVKLKAAILSALIHDWYLIEEINETNLNKIMMYSPELDQVIYEIYTPSFPVKKLKDDLMILSIASYYEEKAFAKLLTEIGYPIEKFKHLSGMSLKKLELLCHHQDAILDLIKYGIDITDFAKADEDRLMHILTHYDKAKYALTVIDPRECLGMSPSFYSPRLFNTTAKDKINHHSNVAPTVDNASYCRIL